MNRDQKAATIATLVADIEGADAVFAVDYRGLTVTQAADLRGRLREADATFRVVKNSLTERAADQSGADALKALLSGPTALTFVHGDAALAAKTLADFARASQLLPFKGGLLDGDALDADQVRSISRLPSRDVLYGQLVGLVASPVSGLVRTLGALVGGLAVALGQVQEKKESGEIPAGEPPAAADEPEPLPVDESAPAGEPTPADEPAGADEPAPALADEARPEPLPEAPIQTPAESEAASETPAEDVAQTPVSDEAPAAEVAPEAQTEPEPAPANDDNQADAPA